MHVNIYKSNINKRDDSDGIVSCLEWRRETSQQSWRKRAQEISNKTIINKILQFVIQCVLRARAQSWWSRFIYRINKLIIVRVRVVLRMICLLPILPLPLPSLPQIHRSWRKISVEFMSYTFASKQQSLNIKS